MYSPVYILLHFYSNYFGFFFFTCVSITGYDFMEACFGIRFYSEFVYLSIYWYYVH
jgi:hypothetical protein